MPQREEFGGILKYFVIEAKEWVRAITENRIRRKKGLEQNPSGTYKPDGLWVIEVRGSFEGMVNGVQCCWQVERKVGDLIG